jgi:hypothetical protein
VDAKTNPDRERPTVQELGDVLTPAVEQARAAAPPAEAVERAVGRAVRIRPKPVKRRRTGSPILYAGAAVAATLLLGICLGANKSQWDFGSGNSRVRESVYAGSEGYLRHPPNFFATEGLRPIAEDEGGDITNVDIGNASGYSHYRLGSSAGKASLSLPRGIAFGDGSAGYSTDSYDSRLNNEVPKSPPIRFPDSAYTKNVTKPTSGNFGPRERSDKVNDAIRSSSPAPDSMIIGGTGAGKVDLRKLNDVAAKWGEMSGKEREEKLRDLGKDLSPEMRDTVGKFFDQLGKSPPPGDKGGSKPAGLPQVWHREGGQPSLARVYVGDGNSLELVSLHVSVTVEGPRARTVVDHVFRNPHDRQLEGTFEYPLPSGASPSYFGMFLGATRTTPPPRFARRGGGEPLPPEALASLTPTDLVRNVDDSEWGRLQEGRVISNDKASEVYEDVVRGRVDPALLEYAGGNTFRGRVFPIAAKGFNRVVLAYEELLPVAGEKMLYRFPLPGCKLSEMSLSVQAATADCRDAEFSVADSWKREAGGRVTFAKTWADAKPEGEAVFSCTPAKPRVQAVTGRQGDNGPVYVYARLRPELPAVDKATGFSDKAVFLLDTSLSEHPDRFAVSMKLLRKILESDPDLREFNVLTFNVGAAWVESKGWLPNTAAGRDEAFRRLDGLLLEGATDLGCALDKLAAPGFEIAKGTPLACFLLSDGNLTWGETDAGSLAAQFAKRCPYPTRWHCYRTGLGQENAELFDALTRDGGGVFTCYGEADVAAAAKAHRRQCLTVRSVRFVGGPAMSDVLVAGRKSAVFPGGELVVTGRAAAAGKTTVVVEGTYRGEKFTQEFPVEVADRGELAPRAWGEVAVASLLSLNDSKLEPLATAYCQQFGVASRVASFLVLENENDYKRLNLEEERGRTLAGDLGGFVEEQWAARGQTAPPRQAFRRLLDQVDKRMALLKDKQGGRVEKLLELLTEDDFDLPPSAVKGALLHAADLTAYVAERDRDPRDAGPFLREAKRRAADGDVDGAVRVLSTIIEEHPSRGDALRLVGYRLLDLEQPGQAAALFARVQRQRPFEPHSYRDLARSLEDCGKFGLAALQYEIVLAGTWHNRFRESLKEVTEEEYARMMQEAIRRGAVKGALANVFGERLEAMRKAQPAGDLRVTISWNTDATDVDLWVIEPDGTKVFYQNRTSKNGGKLSQDMTQGYGPERYQIDHAQPGLYTVIVHYYGVNRNLLGGETHVNVAVVRKAGSPEETVERKTVVLKQHNEQVEVCKVKF